MKGKQTRTEASVEPEFTKTMKMQKAQQLPVFLQSKSLKEDLYFNFKYCESSLTSFLILQELFKSGFFEGLIGF